MNVVKGKDVFLWVFRSGAYVLTACGKSVSMEFEVEDIPIATESSGSDNDYVSGFSDGTVSFEGITTIDEDTKYQFEEWVDNRRARHQTKIVFTDSAGNILQYEFASKVRKVAGTGDVKSLAGTSVLLKICGAVTKTKVLSGGGSGSAPSSGAQAYADWWTTTEGTNYIEGPSANSSYTLTGKKILMVFREGLQYDFVGYSGVPVGRQCRYDNSAERILFDTDLPFNPNETVTVLFEDI